MTFYLHNQWMPLRRDCLKVCTVIPSGLFLFHYGKLLTCNPELRMTWTFKNLSVLGSRLYLVFHYVLQTITFQVHVIGKAQQHLPSFLCTAGNAAQIWIFFTFILVMFRHLGRWFDLSFLSWCYTIFHDQSDCVTCSDHQITKVSF